MFNNIIEDYSPKWKTKKQQQKGINKPVKKNYKKDYESIIEIFLKMKTFTKRNYVNNRNKNISDIGRERKKRIYGKLLL